MLFYYYYFFSDKLPPELLVQRLGILIYMSAHELSWLLMGIPIFFFPWTSIPEADNLTCKELINEYIHKIRITKYNGVMFMFKDSNNDIVVTWSIQPAGAIGRIITKYQTHNSLLRATSIYAWFWHKLKICRTLTQLII